MIAIVALCVLPVLVMLPEDVEVATVGGLLNESLGRIPKRGEGLDWRGYRLTVLSASPRGAELVSIRKID